MESENPPQRVALTAQSLAQAMPRALIADGRSEGLAADWVSRIEEAAAAGQPAFPCYPFDSTVREALFEARRSRQVVRGLEGAQDVLETQEKGLSLAAATQPDANRRRLSRLLIVSRDGSTRFYRGAERLRDRFHVRLEIVMLDCDELELGGACFGDGRRVRALMMNHKDAVVRFLTVLDELSGVEKSGESASGDHAPDATDEPIPD